MKNPLAQILPVEDRMDGVYVNVPREKKGTLSCEEVFKVLEHARVTNYDREKIEEVVSHARGVPEKIGPLFEYYNNALEKYIDVAVSDTHATVKINPDFTTANFSLTPTLLKYCLREKGVRFGMLEENVKKVLEEKIYNTVIVIARCKEVVNGKDAQIKFESECDTSLRPKTRRDGSADFREVHTFTEVSEGQVIARKIPATPGKAGRKVTGELIPSIPGKDVDLPQGKNTTLVEDGLALAASKTGILRTEVALLTVCEQLVIPKDIDYSIGNVKFSGDLIVKGNVKPGFIVEAEGNIEIQGIVESATVKSRSGVVTINKGILGKGDAHIFAKSKIETLFAQETKMETEGVISVMKHCLNCNCVCSIFEATQPQSNLVGGKVKASNYVHATQIGNQKGADTRILLFDLKKGEAQEKLKEYKALKEKVLTSLNPVKKQVSAKAAIFKKAGNLITDRQKAEMKKWIDSYNVLNVKLKHIQEKIDKITDVIKSPSGYDGYVKVTGSIFPGVILEMYGRRKIIQHRRNSKTYQIGRNGEISTEG